MAYRTDNNLLAEFDSLLDLIDSSAVALDLSATVDAVTPSMDFVANSLGSGVSFMALGVDFLEALGDFGEAALTYSSGNFAGTQPLVTSASGLEGPSTDLFDFTVSVANLANEDAEFSQLVADITAAAMSNISQYLTGADGAELDVAVTVVSIGNPNVVASASAGSFFVAAEPDENGVTEIFTAAQLEMAFGQDFNGEQADIVITVNADFILSAAAFLSVAADRVVPDGQIDFVSVLTHEIMHGLGFLSFREADGENFEFDLDGDGTNEVLESTYGTNIEFFDTDAGLTPVYFGQNAVNFYGQGIVLESNFGPGSDISHFALLNPDGSIADTALALMNPSVVNGDVTTIGALELAVLADLGYNVSLDPELGLVNTLDSLDPARVPTASVDPDVQVVNGQQVIVVSLDMPSPFTSLPSSVGVQVQAADGSFQTLRAEFAPGETQVFLPIDAFLASGPLSVTLFYGAQANLENGTNVQTYEVDAGADIGTDGNDRYNGGSGDQAFYGLDGNDKFNGGSGDDFFDGGAGNDRGNGGSGADSLSGGEGNDRLNGGSGDDFLDGGEGHDRLNGGSGEDILLGGGGDDRLNGNSGDDLMAGGSGDDVLLGGSGDDIMLGGSGDDRLIGSSGDDIMIGGDGDDRLIGGSGEDILDAGAGDDILNGGSGQDIFVFGSGYNEDVIKDFNDGEDLIDLSSFSFEEVEFALDNASGRNGRIELDFGNGDILTIRGVDFDDLTLEDFILQEPDVVEIG